MKKDRRCNLGKIWEQTEENQKQLFDMKTIRNKNNHIYKKARQKRCYENMKQCRKMTKLSK